MKRLADWLIARAERRPPNFIIGGAERPYLLRWWLIPRNPIFNIYLHEFRRSDDDRALHSHAYLFNVSIILRNGYWEHTPKGLRYLVDTGRRVAFRFGPSWHRVQLFKWQGVGAEMPCWTIFITGPRVREWGFDCGGRFVHWRDFTATNDAGSVGKGCGD